MRQVFAYALLAVLLACMAGLILVPLGHALAGLFSAVANAFPFNPRV